MKSAGFSNQRASDADLCALIDEHLQHRSGGRCRVVTLQRQLAACHSSFAIEELDVVLSDDRRRQLLFKDLGCHALLDAARRTRPEFLYNPSREILVYHHVLAPNRFSTAECVGSTIDEELGRYWLVIEKVPGLELYRMGDFEIWQEVARWLADMHLRLADDCERLGAAANLLNYDRAFYVCWMRRARRFLMRSEKARRIPGLTAKLDWLAARYTKAVERLCAIPAALIHGEFYPSNVLVEDAGSARRICPVDWETAALGPSLMDLAALTAGRWSDEQRESLALAYRAVLPADPRWVSGRREFSGDLDCCRLHLAIRWLGWSPEWEPPPEHTQDWLGEALRLADELNV